MMLLTHRYYDPTEGRFLNRDPIGYAGGMNLYAYCGGSVTDLHRRIVAFKGEGFP